jgi:myo-inositol-1-phosphate synthase
MVATQLANKLGLSWATKTKPAQKADWLGSITQSSTMRVGVDAKNMHKSVYLPMKDVVPMLNPDDLVIDGWDISRKNLYEAVREAGTLEPTLLAQLEPHLSRKYPMPSIYYPDFIAANQSDRATNLIDKDQKGTHLEIIRGHIRDFKMVHSLESVIVLWTATTERYSDVITGVNDTATNLLRSIGKNHSEISASTIFAVAAIMERCTYINGSPQNTFVPGVIELARRNETLIAGDDFKTGQTKFKSVVVDYLVNAGMRPTSIVSYNHLGNNDGKNLSSPRQFRSKEISKSTVVDDMIESNSILYDGTNHPDHCIVIKYVPTIGDKKRAMDEYVSDICMGGSSVISIYNQCEDSLLAVPLMLDLVVLAELMNRVDIRPLDKPFSLLERDRDEPNFKREPVLWALAYLLKAPLSPKKDRAINSLYRQRLALENFLRIIRGLPCNTELMLSSRV